GSPPRGAHSPRRSSPNCVPWATTSTPPMKTPKCAAPRAAPPATAGATCRRWPGTCATTPWRAAPTRATMSVPPRWWWTDEALVDRRQYPEARWRRHVRQRAAGDVDPLDAARRPQPHPAGLQGTAGAAAQRQDGAVRHRRGCLLRPEDARPLWRGRGAARAARLARRSRLLTRGHRRGGALAPPLRPRRRPAARIPRGRAA